MNGDDDRNAAILQLEDFAKRARDELSALPAAMSSDPATRARLAFEVSRVAARVDAVLEAKVRELRGERWS
jgi:hypothetical protein